MNGRQTKTLSAGCHAESHPVPTMILTTVCHCFTPISLMSRTEMNGSPFPWVPKSEEAWRWDLKAHL